SRSKRFSASVYFLPDIGCLPRWVWIPRARSSRAGSWWALHSGSDPVCNGVLRDGDAHRAGGTADLLLGGLEVVGVEVGHLDLGDLFDLILGERGDRRLAGRARGLVDAERLADQHRRGRRLQGE